MISAEIRSRFSLGPRLSRAGFHRDAGCPTPLRARVTVSFREGVFHPCTRTDDPPRRKGTALFFLKGDPVSAGLEPVFRVASLSEPVLFLKENKTSALLVHIYLRSLQSPRRSSCIQ